MATLRDKKRAKRGGGTLRIPGMKDVEGRIKLPEGDYQVRVDEVTEEEGNAAPYFKWKFKVSAGAGEGGVLYYNTSLATQALWNLRSLMEALGVDIPDEDEEVDTDDFIGRELMVTVEHESYEGKKQSRIVDFWPAENEAMKEAKGGKSKAAARDEDEDEAEEDDAPRKPTRAEKRRAAKAAVKDDGEEDAESDDGDEEEAEEPKSKRSDRSRAGRADKKSAKKKVSLTQDEVNDMGEDELVDLVAEHELDVDLDELSTLRKKRAAVIDALEEAGVIEAE